MGRKKKAKPGERGIKARDLSVELTNVLGTGVNLEQTVKGAALAYEWLLELKNAYLLTIQAKDNGFLLQAHGSKEPQLLTADEVADFIVDDFFAGGTPNPGT